MNDHQTANPFTAPITLDRETKIHILLCDLERDIEESKRVISKETVKLDVLINIRNKVNNL